MLISFFFTTEFYNAYFLLSRVGGNKANGSITECQ